jgi:hypothetical protein
MDEDVRVMDEDVKSWTARWKSALVLDIIQGKTTVGNPPEPDHNASQGLNFRLLLDYGTFLPQNNFQPCPRTSNSSNQ